MDTPTNSQENIASSTQAASDAMPEVVANITAMSPEQQINPDDSAALAAQLIQKTSDPDSLPERVMRLELAMEDLLTFLGMMKQEWAKVEKLFKEFGL